MGDRNIPPLSNPKVQEVYERMYAYYDGMIQGDKLSNENEPQKLRRKIEKEEGRCQREGNGTACWAAKGLKQIQSCRDSGAILQNQMNRALSMNVSNNPAYFLIREIQVAYMAGVGFVGGACHGYLDSARAFMDLVSEQK